MQSGNSYFVGQSENSYFARFNSGIVSKYIQYLTCSELESTDSNTHDTHVKRLLIRMEL